MSSSVTDLSRNLVLFEVLDPDTCELFTNVLVDGKYFSLDVTTSINASGENSITDYPTYEGITRIDQSVKQPDQITLQGIVGKYSFGIRRSDPDMKLFIQMLTYLKDNAILVTVTTYDLTYVRQVIRSINYGKTSSETTTVNLTLREVFGFKPELVRIGVDLGDDDLGGGSDSGNQEPPVNPDILAESLRPKVKAAFNNIDGSNLDKSLLTAMSTIVSLAADYNLGFFTEDSWAAVPMYPQFRVFMRHTKDWDNWPFKPYVTFIERKWTPGFYYNYHYKVDYAIKSAFSLPEVNSDSSGNKIRDLRVTVAQRSISNTISIADKRTRLNFMSKKIADLDGDKDWIKQVVSSQVRYLGTVGLDIPVVLEDKVAGSKNTYKLTLGLGTGTPISRIHGQSPIERDGTGWRFKFSGASYAYSANYIAQGGNDDSWFLKLGFVVLHPTYGKLVKEEIIRAWNVAWGSLGGK